MLAVQLYVSCAANKFTCTATGYTLKAEFSRLPILPKEYPQFINEPISRSTDGIGDIHLATDRLVRHAHLLTCHSAHVPSACRLGKAPLPGAHQLGRTWSTAMHMNLMLATRQPLSAPPPPPPPTHTHTHLRCQHVENLSVDSGGQDASPTSSGGTARESIAACV